MSDERLRSIERRADGSIFSSKLLVEQMRAGKLDPSYVEIAARLGHPEAQALRPDVESVGWDINPIELVLQAVGLTSRPAVLHWTIDVVERFPLAQPDRNRLTLGGIRNSPRGSGQRGPRSSSATTVMLRDEKPPTCAAVRQSLELCN